MKGSLIAVVLAGAVLMNAAPPLVYLGADASQSQAAAAVLDKTEQERLIQALPDGVAVKIAMTGATTRLLFDAVLTHENRVEAIRQIRAIGNGARNTDLGGALDAALGAARNYPGPVTIWIWTDGRNRPPMGVSTPGTPFEALLNKAVIPANTTLTIRLSADGELPRTTAPNVKIVRSSPDFTGLFVSMREAMALAKSGPVRVPEQNSIPLVALIAAAGMVLAGGVFALLYWRGRTRNLMAAQLEPEPEIEPEPLPKKKYAVASDDGLDLLEIEEDGHLAIGSSPSADLVLVGCGDARVRLHATARGLRLTNTGETLVRVGEMAVKAGKSLTLPEQPVAIRIGRETLRAWPCAHEVQEER